MNEWNALQPLSDRDREMLSRRFTIDFNYNSNHIEGNTLTYGQTELLLLFGKIVGEADVRDVHEMTASNAFIGKKYLDLLEKSCNCAAETMEKSCRYA